MPDFELSDTLVATLGRHLVESAFLEGSPSEDPTTFKLDFLGDDFRHGLQQNGSREITARIGGTLERVTYTQEGRRFSVHEFEPGVADPFDPEVYRAPLTGTDILL